MDDPKQGHPSLDDRIMSRQRYAESLDRLRRHLVASQTHGLLQDELLAHDAAQRRKIDRLEDELKDARRQLSSGFVDELRGGEEAAS